MTSVSSQQSFARTSLCWRTRLGRIKFSAMTINQSLAACWGETSPIPMRHGTQLLDWRFPCPENKLDKEPALLCKKLLHSFAVLGHIASPKAGKFLSLFSPLLANLIHPARPSSSFHFSPVP